MATNIQWTDETWNPVVGCSKVSAGCRGCYAEKMAKRLRAMALADIAAGRDPGRKRHYIDAVDERGRWTGQVIPVPEALADPMGMKAGRMIFVNSMSDLFHPTVDFKYIAAVFGVMWACPQHIFQVLTKHPERAAAFFRWLRGAVGKNLTTGGRCVIETDPLTGCQIEAGRHVKLGGYTISSERGKRPVSERSLTWPLPNVWLGTSVENAEVEGRIADLMACEAAVRWVSYEPALGMVDYSKHLREPGWWCERCGTTKSPQQVTHGETCTLCSEAVEWRESLDWIVIGGESGCGARPFNVSWAAGLLEAGKAAGVPVFVKQLGSRPFIGLADMPGRATVDGPTERAWPVALDEIEHPLSPPVRAWRPKLKHPKGGNWDEWPEWLRVREYPASAAALSEVA